MVINIKNEGLTGYYLRDKFQEYLNESGFKFIESENEKEKIEIYYIDKQDLENKLSFILMLLTDK